MYKKASTKIAPLSPEKTSGRPIWYYPSGVVLFTAIIYYSIGSADFLNYDDPSFVLWNTNITNLSFHNIGVIFSSFYLGNYCPLSILSYAVDYHFAGLSPAFFHLMSLFIHLANTWLVFLFVYQLS